MQVAWYLEKNHINCKYIHLWWSSRGRQLVTAMTLHCNFGSQQFVPCFCPERIDFFGITLVWLAYNLGKLNFTEKRLLFKEEAADGIDERWILLLANLGYFLMDPAIGNKKAIGMFFVNVLCGFLVFQRWWRIRQKCKFPRAINMCLDSSPN